MSPVILKSLIAKDFISRLLVVDPRKRFTAKQALHHPFIQINCPPPYVPEVVNTEQVVDSTAAKQVQATIPLQAITDADADATQPSPQMPLRKSASTTSTTNLAQRVSANLRNRGASVSRRRCSVDTNNSSNGAATAGPRITSLYAPTHDAPTAPIARKHASAIQEEESDEQQRLQAKPQGGNADSGISSKNGSQEVSSGKECKADSQAMLKQLSEVNQCIERGDLGGALARLQKSDFPEKLKEIYEDLILTANIAASIEPSTKAATEAMDSLKLRSSAATLEANITSPQPQTASTSSTGSGAAKNLISSKQLNLRILSLDLQCLPPGLKSNNCSNHKEKRLRRFMDKVLPNYDIVMLQGLFSTGTKRCDRLIKRAIQLGYRSWVASNQLKAEESVNSTAATVGVPLLLESARFDGGLLVLSRERIVRSSKFVYSKSAGTDKLYGKGALYAEIHLADGSQLHLFNTQLQQSFHPSQMNMYNPTDSVIFARHNQLRELKSFILQQLQTAAKSFSSAACQCAPIILLGGNMNINSRKFTEPHRHANEYLTMKKIMEEEGGVKLCMYDCLYEQYGEHPITFGQSTVDGKPVETLLTDLSMQRVNASLDYIFQLTLVDQKQLPTAMRVESIKVDRFAMDSLTATDNSKQTGDTDSTAVTNSLDSLNSASSGSIEAADYPAEVMIEMKTLVNGAWEIQPSGQHSEDRILNEMEMGSAANIKVVEATTNTAATATGEQPQPQSNSAKSNFFEEKMGKVLAFLGRPTASTDGLQLTQLSSHHGISCLLASTKQ